MIDGIDTCETKYLIFNKFRINNKKTYDVCIRNKKNEMLGKIHWRTGWRTYVVTIQPCMDLDIKCWNDIGQYVDQLLQERLNRLAIEKSKKKECKND
jgi:hypothetical protein